MKITSHCQGGLAHYRLEAENSEDRAFLHAAIGTPHALSFQLIERAPNPDGPGEVDHSATLTFNPTEPRALEAQASRQAFRALGDLSRLLFGDPALNRHASTDAANPQAQEQLTAVLEKFQLVAQSFSDRVGQLEAVLEKVNATHDALLNVNSGPIVVEGGAA